MIDFYFGVLTYNQEKLVIETLESIKYQIEHYGEEYTCKLIIIDDCSKDGTVRVISSWCEENMDVFDEIKIIGNPINQGTVKNYNCLLKEIGSSYFKIMAGDDLLSCNNLFELYADLNSERIISCYPIYLENGNVYIKYADMLMYFYFMKCQKNFKKNLKYMKRYRYFHTPSTLYTKQLYDQSNCRKLNMKFRLLEDEPSWYSMMKNNSSLDVRFYDKSIVLYRLHDNSVSNGKKKDKSEFDLELLKLFSFYYEDAKGLEKIYWLLKKHDIHILEKIDWKLKRMYAFVKYGKSKEFHEFLKVVNENVKKQKMFYDEIVLKNKCRKEYLHEI